MDNTCKGWSYNCGCDGCHAIDAIVLLRTLVDATDTIEGQWAVIGAIDALGRSRSAIRRADRSRLTDDAR